MTAGPIVDVHAHILLPETIGGCGDAGPEIGLSEGLPFLRAGDREIRGLDIRDSPLSRIEKRLDLMNRMGVDHQLLSPMPMFYFYDQPADAAIRFAQRHNDALADVVGAHPDRFSGLATLPMQVPAAAVEELTRAVERLGLRGAQIGQGCPGKRLSAPEYEALWAACERLDVPLIVHPEPLAKAQDDTAAGSGGPGWDLCMVAGLPGLEFSVIAELVFSGVLDRHPVLRIVIPHGGGSAPFNKGRLEMALRRRPWGRGLLHRSFDDIWGQLWFDCLVHGAGALRFLIDAAGARRVLLGTSASAWDQDDEMVATVRGLGLSAADERRVLCGNAARLFGLFR